MLARGWAWRPAPRFWRDISRSISRSGPCFAATRHAAVGEPGRSGHVGDALRPAQASPAAMRSPRPGSPLPRLSPRLFALIEQRHQIEVDLAPAQRLERFAVMVARHHGPESMTGSLNSSTSMPRCARALRAWDWTSAGRRLADEIVDFRLVRLEVRDILLERARLAGGRVEACELEQRFAPLEVLVDAFLSTGANASQILPKASVSFSARFFSSLSCGRVMAFRIPRPAECSAASRARC